MIIAGLNSDPNSKDVKKSQSHFCGHETMECKTVVQPHCWLSVAAGCLEIAEEFRSQEIDGQALLLLKEDHLMGTMNIKLGPALKIFDQISMLKDS